MGNTDALTSFQGWQSCVSKLFCLVLGFICGHFLYILIFSYDLNSNVDMIRHIQPKFVSEEAKINHLHEPPATSYGISRKKDMSIQFREYQPRNIFLNIGGTLPKALHLFLDTYPNAKSYDLYSFIHNSSFYIHYKTFQKHTLFTPVLFSGIDKEIGVVPEETGNLNNTNNGGAGNEESEQSSVMVDLMKFIRNSTHQDDYVILKVEHPGELLILKQLVETETVEWIDKYYSASNSKVKVLQVKKNITRDYNLKIYTWDDENGTYSDFDDTVPIRVPPIGGVTIHNCKAKGIADEKLGLLFYADKATKGTKRKLAMLLEYAENRKLKPGLFLSVDFLNEYEEFSGELFRVFRGGLHGFIDASLSSAPDKQYFTLRNTVVKATHIMEHLPQHIILQYIFLQNISNRNVTNRLKAQRHITIFTGVKDITPKSKSIVEGKKLNLSSKFTTGSILSINMDVNNTDVLAIYIMKAFENQIIPFHKCAIP